MCVWQNGLKFSMGNRGIDMCDSIWSWPELGLERSWCISEIAPQTSWLMLLVTGVQAEDTNGET